MASSSSGTAAAERGDEAAFSVSEMHLEGWVVEKIGRESMEAARVCDKVIPGSWMEQVGTGRSCVRGV